MTLWSRSVGSAWHQRAGRRLAPVVAAAVFIAAWIGGVREWGVLLGGGFGWLPAAFLAGFAGAATYFLWLPLVLVGVLAGAVTAFAALS